MLCWYVMFLCFYMSLSISPATNTLTFNFLQLWVFTPDLIYTTSDEREGRRSMKIFYRTISDPSTRSEVSSDSKVEELQFPSYVVRQVLLDLRVSTNILPASSRYHQLWTIGLLDR